MPRVCNRERCGRRLLRRDGSNDFRSHFCSPGCKNADAKEKKQALRARFAGKKCPYCGRSSTGDHQFKRGVSRDAPSSSDEPGSLEELRAGDGLSAPGSAAMEK